MKFSKLLYVVFLCSCIIGNGAHAQDAKSGKDYSINNVGLIDLSAILRNAEASTKVRELLDVKREEFAAEFQEKESGLLQEERELNLKRGIMSDVDFNAEVQKFQQKVADVQKEIQFKRRSLDQAFQEAQAQLRELAIEIVTEIASREQLDMVLTRESALIFRPDLNITDEVLERLNERTKNARIEVGKLPF